MSPQRSDQRAPGIRGGADWHERIGRAGFLAKGILYGIIGIVAVAVSAGGESKTADQTGALRSLGDSGWGEALLVALAVGLGAYALFRLVEVFEGPENEDGAKEKLLRAASVVRFLVYASLCVSAVRIIGESGTSGGNEAKTTSTVFDLPGGVALVFAAGLVLIGVGLYQGYTGLTASFEDDFDTARMSRSMQRTAKALGTAGHLARTVVFILIGGFLIKAAVEHDAKEAVGLDGALKEISQQTAGELLLGVVAVGLFVYGAFCLIEARYRKL